MFLHVCLIVFSLEFEWQQISSNLLDSSRYFSLYQQHCTLYASIHPLISNSFSSLSKSLWTILSAPIIIGITVTYMFHGFISQLARSKNLSLFHFLWFTLCGSLGWQSPLHSKFSFLFFLFLIITWSGLLARIRWYYYYSLNVFHTGVSWWSFTGVIIIIIIIQLLKYIRNEGNFFLRSFLLTVLVQFLF